MGKPLLLLGETLQISRMVCHRVKRSSCPSHIFVRAHHILILNYRKRNIYFPFLCVACGRGGLDTLFDTISSSIHYLQIFVPKSLSSTALISRSHHCPRFLFVLPLSTRNQHLTPRAAQKQRPISPEWSQVHRVASSPSRIPSLPRNSYH